MADGGRVAAGVAEAGSQSIAPHRRPESGRRSALSHRATSARWDDRMTQNLPAADERVAAGAVKPTLALAAIRRELAEFDFGRQRPTEALLSWVIAPYNPAPAFPAQCTDRMVSAFNPQLATSTTSSVAVEIEAHEIGVVARGVGLPAKATGHFTTVEAPANYTALICALTRAHADLATKGARTLAGPPVFCVSRGAIRCR
jgi:aromatic-L-amino-acid/L-tryptophan decarboxylase